MIVRAIGGLANRLRVILSRPGDSFVWARDAEVAGASFFDVFEPIAGLVFVECDRPYITTTDPSWELEPPEWIPRYRALRPVQEVRERIAMLRSLYGDYDAMHIRRTDSGALVEQDDDPFLDWARGRDDRDRPRETVYLATDNGRTQDKFKAWLGPALEVNRWITNKTESMPDGSGERLTTLQDAVVDLYMCAHASEFRGSSGSSYSQLVHYLRDLAAIGPLGDE